MRTTDWLSSGGAYWVLSLEILGSALLYAIGGIYLGKIARAENDGCLLAIANVLAAIAGGAVGFFCAHYPLFIVTTLGGTLMAPALVTAVATARFRRNLR